MPQDAEGEWQRAIEGFSLPRQFDGAFARLDGFHLDAVRAVHRACYALYESFYAFGIRYIFWPEFNFKHILGVVVGYICHVFACSVEQFVCHKHLGGRVALRVAIDGPCTRGVFVLRTLGFPVECNLFLPLVRYGRDVLGTHKVRKLYPCAAPDYALYVTGLRR